MFDTNRVERLLSNAVRTLPHEVLCLIASRHLRIWEASAEERDVNLFKVVFELETAFHTARTHCYRDMEYAYLLPADAIEDDTSIRVSNVPPLFSHTSGISSGPSAHWGHA